VYHQIILKISENCAQKLEKFSEKFCGKTWKISENMNKILAAISYNNGLANILL
jgi:hypothetical protein